MYLTATRLATPLVLSFALLLTACTSGSPEEPVEDESDTLSQMIDEGLANAQSDFQKEVLVRAKKTGKISEADWKEANNQTKECMAALGYDIDITYEGSNVLMFMDAEGDEDDPANKKRRQDSMECGDKTSAYINEIYSYLAGDQPDGDEQLRAVFDCIIENELAPKDTTFDEFEADLEQNDGEQYGMSDDPDKTGITKCWTDNL